MHDGAVSACTCRWPRSQHQMRMRCALLLLSCAAYAVRGVNLIDSDFVQAHAVLKDAMENILQHPDSFTGHLTAPAAHARTRASLCFLGDSTIRNVFTALCVLMGVPWTTLEQTWGCQGSIGQTNITATYWMALYSLRTPVTHDYQRCFRPHVEGWTSAIYIGVAQWLFWPSPFILPQEWPGFDTWLHYEDELRRVTNQTALACQAMPREHCKLVIITPHSVCDYDGAPASSAWPTSAAHANGGSARPTCPYNYQSSKFSNLSAPIEYCVQYVKQRNQHVSPRQICQRATCGPQAVARLHRRLWAAVCQEPLHGWGVRGYLAVVDSFNLTAGQCWANDGDHLHFPFLIFSELRLFLHAALERSDLAVACRRQLPPTQAATHTTLAEPTVPEELAS